MSQRAKTIPLPSEDNIRTRLSHLAVEANTLRSLLRLVRKRTRLAQVVDGNRKPREVVAHG